MLRTATSLLALSLSLTACYAEAETTTTPASGSASSSAVDGTYTVACGCSLESVGHCGNYIQVADAYHEIANGGDFGLGAMEWCGQGESQAQATGTLEADRFVATAFKTL